MGKKKTDKGRVLLLFFFWRSNSEGRGEKRPAASK